jgi:carboxymethylenebutenolidase
MARALVPELSQRQVHLGEQMIDQYRQGAISRRTMLRRLAFIGGGGVAAASLLAACAGENPGAVAGAPDAAPDAGRDAGAGADVDEGGVDAGDVDGGDGAVDLAEDAAADQAAAEADAAADAPARGILSVPADDPDVTVKELTYQSNTELRAYLAVPNRVGSFAGLILIHDDRGLTEHIKDVARRFAKSGCVAMAPDLGSRISANASLEELLADLGAGLETLARQPQVGANRYGVTGFGFGGGLALRFAAANPKVRAAVPYYGSTPMPADVMKATNAAILGHYGATDDPVNAGIPELERVMKEAGKTFEKRLYSGARHAFNDDTDPRYDEPAAVSAWAVTIGWFEMYLG